MDFANLTNIGRLRATNEDSSCAEVLPTGPLLLAVADGMGGHQGGEVASRLAIDSLRDALRASAQPPWRERLLGAAEAAHALICDRAAEEASLYGMGTTLTATLIDAGQLAWVHVGDSRAYLWHAGELVQLTDDHSLVGELVRDGQLDQDAATQHPQRNVLTRALGASDPFAADAGEADLVVGDWVLLATDGLTHLVGREELVAELRTASSPQELARRLVDRANQSGGTDNITVVVARA